ncbi:MAG: propionyl-CoA carboxylase alpha chain [Anaerolineaceae bacterium]|nr:MAG: propionyl-CoA carboxylase alpha chain [Anaerolineaceae bacterium]
MFVVRHSSFVFTWSLMSREQSNLPPSLPTGLPSDYKTDERILAPIPGVVTKVFVKAGEQVKAGDPLLVIEAMKMRNTIRSAHALTVAAVNVKENDVVKAGQMLVEFGHD